MDTELDFENRILSAAEIPADAGADDNPLRPRTRED